MTDMAVKTEPLTYRRDVPHSYFRDLIYQARGENAAGARIARHADEMRVEVPKRQVEREARARAAGFELRTNPNRTDGQGGYFSPPAWLVDDFATAPRPHRVLAARMPGFALPQGVSQINVPRITTGSSTATENDLGSVSSTDIVDAAASSPVTPIAGEEDISMQLLEQSPPGAHMDFAVFQDLHADYDKQLETLLLNGSGSSGQFTGIFNLTTGAGGVSAVTYTDLTPTVAEMLPFIGQAIGQLGDARGLPPEVLMMRTARWAWIAVGDTNILSGGKMLAGYPVVENDAIPTSVGGAGQDAIVPIRPSDALLLETDPVTHVMGDVLSNNLKVRLQLHGYAAAIFRQPTGISTITGSGMTVQSGF